MSLITHEFKVETVLNEVLKRGKDVSDRAWRKSRLKEFKRFIDSLDDDYKGLRLYEVDGMRVSEAAVLVRLGVDPDGLATTLVKDVLVAEEEILSGYSIQDEHDYADGFHCDRFIAGLISRYAMDQGLLGSSWPKREKVMRTAEETFVLKVDDWFTDAYESNLIARDDLTTGIERALVDGSGELINYSYSKGELQLTFAPNPDDDDDEYCIAWRSNTWFTSAQAKELATLGILRGSWENVLPAPRRGDTARFVKHVREVAEYVAALSDLLWEKALSMQDVERLHYLRGQNGVKRDLPNIDNRRIDMKLIKSIKQSSNPKVSPPYPLTDLMDYLLGSGSQVDRSVFGELIESRLIQKRLTCSRGRFVTRYTDSLLISIDRSDPGLIIEGTGADILDSLYVSEQTLTSDMMPGDMVELHYIVMVADSGEVDFHRLFKRAKHNLGVMNSYTHASLNRLAGSGRKIKLSDICALAKPSREASLREFATALVKYGAKYTAEISPCWCRVQLEREMEGRKEQRRNPAELVVDVPIYAGRLRARGNVLSSLDSRYIVTKDKHAVWHIATERESQEKPNMDGEEIYMEGPLAGQL